MLRARRLKSRCSHSARNCCKKEGKTVRQSMPGKVKLLVMACGAATLLAAGAGIAVASSSSSSPQPVRSRPMSRIGAEATYGVKDGKPFMHLVKGRIVGHYKPSSLKAVPNQTVECTEYISNVSKALGNVPFYWVTQQTCTGPFGYQFMSTQMWRSSYRGPLGY